MIKTTTIVTTTCDVCNEVKEDANDRYRLPFPAPDGKISLVSLLAFKLEFTWGDSKAEICPTCLKKFLPLAMEQYLVELDAMKKRQ